MPIVQDLVSAGYTGYQGWGEAEAAADFAATGGAGKEGGGGTGGNIGGQFQPFNFDYEKSAQEAYGELGSYYDRILKESRGDLNLALARLKEDYDRGTRTRKEDVGLGRDALTVAQEEANRLQSEREKNLVSSALGRGIYQESGFGRGFGLGGQNIEQSQISKSYSDLIRQRQAQELERGYGRTEQEQGLSYQRRQTDLPEDLRRKEFDLEQQRRREAADLANLRGDRAYRKFSTELV